MELRINISFKRLLDYKDSERRSEHVFDRMQSRGIGLEQIREGVQRGAKKIRTDGVIESEFRWYRIVYREFRMYDIRKIYPITVMEVKNAET